MRHVFGNTIAKIKIEKTSRIIENPKMILQFSSFCNLSAPSSYKGIILAEIIVIRHNPKLIPELVARLYHWTTSTGMVSFKHFAKVMFSNPAQKPQISLAIPIQ